MGADDKLTRLEQIKADILQGNICPDLAETATQLVVGEGSPDADIVFIGEAPGKKEDEQGEPFVGASGRFLNEMLAAAGLERGDVYITNIVKYRPPHNRDPSSEEKRAFLPYLRRQLEVIQPKVVITLGRHSGMCFIPDFQIGKEHGQARLVAWEGSEFLVIPLYHPAAALYNGSMRQVLMDDFLRVAQLVQNQA